MGYLIKTLWILIGFILFMICFRGNQVDRFATKVLCDTTIPPESERKLENMPTERPPSQTSILFQKIPRIIMQTNERSLVPEEMAKCSQTIIESNPEYEYIYFDDERARDYLSENFDERILAAYDKLKPGAYKADLFRYCFLYKNGGVYIDTGMKEVAPLKELITPKDEFISPEDNNTTGLYNAFICCSPSHPIIKEALEETIINTEVERYGRQPLDVSGPTVFGRAFEKVTGSGVFPNTEYKNNIKVIKYIRTGFCNTSGEIWDGKKLFFITRYPTYHIDAKWYNTNQHYSDMWRKKDIFNTPSDIALKKHQSNLYSLFKVFITFAEKHGLVWWASGGTLLGAIREKKMIAWDDDIDIDIPVATKDYLLLKTEELDKLGLKFEYDDYIWRIRFIKGGAAYIDLFEVSNNNGKWLFTEEQNTKRWSSAYFKDDELFPLAKYEFGNLKINGAKSPEHYLTRCYKDWKTPVKEKGHHFF